MCPTLSDTMDCSPPGSSVHGIFQVRVLEWVAIALEKYKLQVCISDMRPGKRCWHGCPCPGPWPICISVIGGPQTCKVSAPPTTPTYWARIWVLTASQVVLIYLEMHCWKKTGADLPDSIDLVNLSVKFLLSFLVELHLYSEDPLEKGMAIHSSIPVLKIPWTEEPSRLQSMGCCCCCC